MNSQKTELKPKHFWQRIPIIITAIFIGLFINTSAVSIWPALSLNFSIPLAFVIMSVFLVIYCKYLSGSWAPQKTKATRKMYFRSINLSKKTWLWGSLGALTFFFITNAFAELFYRFIPFPEDAYSITVNYFKGLSPNLAILSIIMTSIVAGIAEEIGFRGYMQKPLEKKYGPFKAILIVTLVFTLIHIPNVSNLSYLILICCLTPFFGILAYTTNSLLPVILVHVAIDIYGFLELSGFIGNRDTSIDLVFNTGIDKHFITQSAILVITLVLFFVAVKKLMKLKNQTNS